MSINEHQVIQDLQDLMRFPSVGGSKAEAEIQQWCADRLTAMGLDVDHWRIDLDELGKHPEFPGMEVDRTEAWGCVGILGSGKPAVILNGHVDVVPAATYDSELENGILHGRGSCDMKGGVAAILNAVQALTETKLDKAVAVHLVIGEEDGGVGTFATLERGHTGEACLIAEPTAHHIIPANAGSLTFRLEITGKATHGATRTHGVSAIEKFETIHTALKSLEQIRNKNPDPLFAHLDLANPLSIGTVNAGDWASTVPDTLTADGRFGVRLNEPVHEARRAFEEAVADACANDEWLKDHPAKVSWQGGVFASGAIPQNHPLLHQTQEAARKAGAPKTPGVAGGPYGSDLRQYAAKNIPTLQYGPGDVRHAHAKNEHVHIKDVVHCARTYALLAAGRSGALGGYEDS